MRTAGSLINIDVRPEVAFEAEARVVSDERGRPSLVPMQISRWNAHLGRLVGKGVVRVTVAREKGARSSQQNRFLWSVVYEDYLNGLKARAADCGMACPFRTKDDLHYHLKHKYIGQGVEKLDDETVLLEPSSADLDIEQFSNYVSAIMAEAAQRQIYIRHPGEELESA